MRFRSASALVTALGLWAGILPSTISAADRGIHFLPTVLLRSTGQYITPSGEKTAVLCGPEGIHHRVFEVSYPIARLELSADETVVRIGPTEGPGDCFDVRSGSPVPLSSFVAITEPARPKYRIKGVPPFAGRLEVVEVATGKPVRVLTEVHYVCPANWLPGGVADIPVGIARAGDTWTAVLRFDPATSDVRETVCFPSSFEVAEFAAIDVDRGLAFLTSTNFTTSIIDVRTGLRRAYVHHQVTPPPPPVVQGSSADWFTPGTALVAVGAGIGGVYLLVLAGRSLWKRARRQTLTRTPKSPEAADYSEPPVP